MTQLYKYFSKQICFFSLGMSDIGGTRTKKNMVQSQFCGSSRKCIVLLFSLLQSQPTVLPHF